MEHTHDLRVSARTAELLASAGDDEDGPPYTFSGVAVAAGDILHMDDGTPVLFTAEELRKAAETQAGEPLTKDHPEDENGRPQYPPPTDQTVGKVPKAGWLESHEAVGYEATTHDETISKGIQAGSYDVSVHPQFALGKRDPETGAYLARDIRFRDLSVVSKGDSPSNTANWGPNQALASLTAAAIGSELTASTDANGTSSSNQEGVIASTVRGTLRALGFEADALEYDEIETETTGAESPVDDGSQHDMDQNKREQYVTFLTANAGFDEKSVSEMDDDVLEQTYELAAQAGDDEESDDDEGSSTTADDETADGDGGDGAGEGNGDLDAVFERLDEMEEKMITTDDVGELTDEVTAHATKAEKVDEIIASSDDYDADDREELIASADKIVDREYERLSQGSQLPGTTGSLTASVPSFSTSDDEGAEDLDEYGTGVQGD